MQKVYSRINWENYPSENTPLNESNLNRMDYAVDEIDNRIIDLDTTNLKTTEASTLIKAIDIDDETGVMTITRFNGSIQTIQTMFNQIAVDFDYDVATQQFTITLEDGTKKLVDLAAIITQNEFADTDTVGFEIRNGTVYANVLKGSITNEHLQGDYLGDIRVSEANAAASEQNADLRALDSEAWAVGQRDGVDVERTDNTYQNNSLWYSRQSRSWAIGDTGTRYGEETNNSKYYCDTAQAAQQAVIDIRDEAQTMLNEANSRLTGLSILVNLSDGCLYYDMNFGIMLSIDTDNGNLMWEVTV